RIVGERVEARHQIARRDGRDGGWPHVLQWKRLRTERERRRAHRDEPNRRAHRHRCTGSRARSIICTVLDPKFVRRSTPPSAVTRISRGNAPAGIEPRIAPWPAVTLAASTTVNICRSVESPAKRFELVTTILRPLSITAMPTGAVPTGTRAMSARVGSE